MKTRVNLKEGVYYPQVQFRLFWVIPTPIYRNILDLHYDIVDGEYLDTVCFTTRYGADEYLKENY